MVSRLATTMLCRWFKLVNRVRSGFKETRPYLGPWVTLGFLDEEACWFTLVKLKNFGVQILHLQFGSHHIHIYI